MFHYRIDGKNISKIIMEVYKQVENEPNSLGEEATTISSEFDNFNLGKVSYLLTSSNEIKISFSASDKNILILRNYLYLMDERNNENKSLIFTKSDLENAFKLFSESNYFIIDDKIIEDINETISLKPKIIKLRKKVFNEVSLDIFKELNDKQNIPLSDSISIDTNRLISQNIYSLRLYRDQKISLVINKRNELIKEIKEFMDNREEKIMKIYGVDGIGKSLTFVYLTSLINNFKIIYFNLKEFHSKKYLELINIFKSQLTNYYTPEIDDLYDYENKKEIINKNTFDDYFESMKKFDSQIMNKINFDFWDLIQIFVNDISMSFRYKVLIIIDQYKIENDLTNKLASLEMDRINSISNIKLLIISSINDMRVKNDFIELLEDFLGSESNKIIQQIDKNYDDTPNQDEKIEKLDDYFEEFSQDKEKIGKEEDDFEKIKKFNIIYEDNKYIINEDDKKNEDEDIQEKKYINKIANYYDKNKIHSNKFNNNKKYRIIYLNDLISIENLNDEEELIKKKMKAFNYNPKYYNKFKRHLLKKESINEAYDEFLQDQFNNIRDKILKFYDDFIKKFNIELKNRDIGLMLIQLKIIVEKKVELNFSSLIYYLNKFPIKYLKIVKIDDNEKNNILKFNDEISNCKFRLEYVFPFFKIIINRLIFEYGDNRDINCTDLPPSGIGNFLEKQIRKGIIIQKIFPDFQFRNVWTFVKSLYVKTTPKKKTNEKKKEGKAKRKHSQKKVKKKKTQNKDKESNKKQEQKQKNESNEKESNENNEVSDENEEMEESKEKEENKEKVENEDNNENEENKEILENQKDKIQNDLKKDEIDKDCEGNEENINIKIKNENNKEDEIATKIDFFNLKELTYDDKINNPLKNYNVNYYIACHRSNNPLLDSVILIPCSNDNKNDKNFNLLSLQITISKWKIYTLEEYHQATEMAAIVMESTYGINIKDKYFSFVLSKEYESNKTQENLGKFGIPFIFFSSSENCFYFVNNKKIKEIYQLLSNEFKLSKNQKKEISFYFKKNMFKKMEDLLQKKRKRDINFQINEYSFNYIRKKLINDDNELILTAKTKNEIIDIINKTQIFKNKAITLKFIFRIKFSEYEALISCNDDYLIGVCFFQNEIFLVNRLLGSRMKIISKEKKM